MYSLMESFSHRLKYWYSTSNTEWRFAACSKTASELTRTIARGPIRTFPYSDRMTTHSYDIVEGGRLFERDRRSIHLKVQSLSSCSGLLRRQRDFIVNKCDNWK